MHEMTIARCLIEMANEEAESRGAPSVTKLQCRIGVMRQVDAWLLREAFEVVQGGTVCGGAELIVESVEVSANCPTCRRRFPVKDAHWHCPACGAEGTDFCGGDELELVSVEIETNDAAHVAVAH